MSNDNHRPLGWRDFAHELRQIVLLASLEYFELGIEELLRFDHQDGSEIRRYGGKIIAMTEFARETLCQAGVEISLFVFCPPESLPFKVAYFNLLCMIRRRRGAFPAEHDDRITQLLSPLCVAMPVVGLGADNPRAQLGIEELLVAMPALQRNKLPPGSDIDSLLMPPPDVLMKKQQERDAKLAAKHARLAELRKKYMDLPCRSQRRLAPKQYPTGKHNDTGGPFRPQKVLVPKQYPAGNPYYAGGPSRSHGVLVLVPKQYPAGNPYYAGGPSRSHGVLVPKQYPAGNPYDAGGPYRSHRVLVPKQYPAGNPYDAGGPSRPGRVLTRTKTQTSAFFEQDN
ncbi:hypothetical protein K503DRAFT_857045 [Rhizopogon vinicolor AM-OR11-026]|uniref:Uncharacterized protein n=1 Tax=Rhizopogon vinicolor AM-OR11-026 TaxID=1314800 RepID=A0A1B7MZB0_9AGAM|nr:hypothetical protein K503DRAFT_857045 [Rhizopogon vinicolor AM-OR11-026]